MGGGKALCFSPPPAPATLTVVKRLLPLLALAVAPHAHAGEITCVLDQGVVVVPAVVAGAAGDYILDTAAPRTLVHETRAQTDGISTDALQGEVRIAGMSRSGVNLTVADLDARAWSFPTPVAGVIGADVLGDFVVDVRFAPCRVRLSRPGHAPALRGGAVYRFSLSGVLPSLPGAAADGPRATGGAVLVSTGADTGLRLSSTLAQAPGAAKPTELLPYGIWRAWLRGFSLSGRLWEHLPVGLAELPDGALGTVGPPLLAGWDLRIDYPRRRITLRPRG